MKQELTDRLIRYTKINTRSNPYSTSIPSTQNQFDLAKVLLKECQDMGLEDVKMSNVGVVSATLPSNVDESVATIGFIAHMDTADFNSENVNPRVIENYDGKDIILSDNIVTDIKTFPNLLKYKGDTLVVTDGHTLLGADNKAGIANILTAMNYLLKHPEIKHGDVRIAFTIDEEIGTGADSFDVADFNADFAYTVDGGGLGEMEYETFNAAGVTVTFKGISVHPGSAKDTMINANILVHEFISALPQYLRPEHTSEYQGFYMVDSIQSTLENATMEIIIRDHDRTIFEAKKAYLMQIEAEMNRKYPQSTVKVEIKDSYYNMKEILDQNMHIVELAKQAIESIGLSAIIAPVRGGTDGSRLSFMGLPTPNIFTGAENFHGKHEFASIDAMQKSVEMIVEIIILNYKNAKERDLEANRD